MHMCVAVCIPMTIYVEARDHNWASSSIFWVSVLLLEWPLDWNVLASNPLCSTHLSLSPDWGHREVPASLGTQTQAFMLVQQALYLLSTPYTLHFNKCQGNPKSGVLRQCFIERGCINQVPQKTNSVCVTPEATTKPSLFFMYFISFNLPNINYR